MDAAGQRTSPPVKETKRRKTEANSSKPQALQYVYLVVHDREPPGDRRFHFSRVGTEVVGVYTSFENARLAADNYVVDSNIYELEDEENDMRLTGTMRDVIDRSMTM